MQEAEARAQEEERAVSDATDETAKAIRVRRAKPENGTTATNTTSNVAVTRVPSVGEHVAYDVHDDTADNALYRVVQALHLSNAVTANAWLSRRSPRREGGLRMRANGSISAVRSRLGARGLTATAGGRGGSTVGGCETLHPHRASSRRLQQRHENGKSRGQFAHDDHAGRYCGVDSLK